ncbi:hypothetical protein FACS1894216_22120 [Synergistales bacterium]|nr:hypothetical protein FACS1894216_22120 [Synergistales bacterium]
MREYPLVSIIIPVYNGENYLRDAIDSALAQTYRNCEVIVVNDGSTDDTENICRSYGDSIRYLYKENGGVSTALNLGIQEMRGEYFSWLAHDDMYYPYKTERQIAALEGAPDKTAIVHGNYDLLNVKHNTISQMRQEDSYRVERLTNSVFVLLMTTLHACTALIHKSNFERVGLFDEDLPLTQDHDLLFRAMRGRRSIFSPEPLLLSRLHDLSGKNTNDRCGFANAEMYKHFADALTYDEIRDMFVSPRAFYLRIAAMMKARIAMMKTPVNTSGADDLLARIAELPEETENSKIADYIRSCSGGRCCNLCVFGAGYQGKLLKFEMERRRLRVSCFGDNDEHKHGTIIEGIPCVSFDELAGIKSDILVIIATDLSDIIETQLKGAGFPYVITKKNLDALILESPPAI